MKGDMGRSYNDQGYYKALNLNVHIKQSEERFSATAFVQSHSGNDLRAVFLRIVVLNISRIIEQKQNGQQIEL